MSIAALALQGRGLLEGRAHSFCRHVAQARAVSEVREARGPLSPLARPPPATLDAAASRLRRARLMRRSSTDAAPLSAPCWAAWPP